ncbi:MAG: cation-efflux pump [Patescibacteria group bacterium]|nr:cation-efflux pump [Patescibacteria group bacterium]
MNVPEVFDILVCTMSSEKKKNVALSSVFASLLLTIFKLTVGILTGSIGIISEAAHSALDLAAAFITYLAVKVSGQPADFTHHYGHGKAESVSAFIETALLLLTSVWIVYESVHRLISGSVEIQVTWYAFAVMIVSIIVDFSRSRALKRVAAETKSQALEADALHFSSDIYSSLVVIAGLLFVMLGVKGADAFAAIGVAGFVAVASVKLGKRTIDVLMDKAPDGLTETLKTITERIDGVVGVKRIRVRPAGESIFVDMIVNISRKTPLERVNKITKSIQQSIQRHTKKADVVVHVNPVAIEGETITERIHTIAANHNVEVHNIFIHNENGKRSIGFDLEVEPGLSLSQAHRKASLLEDVIREEIGEDTIINTHIEPTKPPEIKSEEIDRNELSRVQNVIENIKPEIDRLYEIHKIDIRKNNDKFFVSMHCVLEKKVSIEYAHNISDKVERMIKDRLPEVEHVVIHLEPFDKRKIKRKTSTIN